MDSKDKKKNISLIFCIITSLVAGFFVFVSFFGFHVINPENINWIAETCPDLNQCFIGWCFFRNAHWYFPIGLFDTLSYPIKASILNTLSIPLFAFFFKLLSPILPQNFQYIGIWAVFNYMLQSMFAMLLIRKFTKDNFLGNIVAILSGILLTISPVILIRTFWHTSTISHWLILVCFIPIIYGNELKTKHKLIIYGLIGLLSALINPYIVAICGLIVLAYSVYSTIKLKKISELSFFGLYCLLSLLMFYLTGVFSQNAVSSGIHLYVNSFNLNGFINSMGTCRLLNLKFYDSYQMEGYTYFGLGVLFILSITLISYIINMFDKNFRENFLSHKKELSVIFVLIIVATVLALSPRVTLFDNVLFEIPYPDFIIDLWSILRCTGRFIWIVNYIILISGIAYLCKHFSNKTLLPVLIVAIALQLYDTAPVKKIYTEPSRSDTNMLSFNNEVFDKIGSSENKIKNINFDKILYMEADESFSYIFNRIAWWAKNKNINLNYYYFARKLNGVDDIYFKKIQNPKNDDIFIFKEYEDFLALTGFLKKDPKQYYVYMYSYITVVRSIPIIGWEDYRIE